jgi:hypothetical protein
MRRFKLAPWLLRADAGSLPDLPDRDDERLDASLDDDPDEIARQLDAMFEDKDTTP